MPKYYRVYCVTEALDVFVVAEFTPTVCPNNSAHTINANSISIADNLATGPLLFGDGSDGDISITSGTTTLARDMYYRNLTMSNAAILQPAGHRIFVSDTLTMSGTANINVNGGSGNSATGGSIPYTNAFLSSSTAGGNGGAVGSAGSSGGAMVGAVRMGGLGGNGGLGAGGVAAGSAGTGTIVATTSGGQSVWRIPTLVLRGTDASGNKLFGGTGGGGGGGGGSAAGTGGGAGGGIIILCARTIVMGASNTITSTGGNSPNTGASTGGSGGGGGGGCIVVISTSNLGTFTITAAGGVAGTSSGTKGSNGNAGQVILLTV